MYDCTRHYSIVPKSALQTTFPTQWNIWKALVLSSSLVPRVWFFKICTFPSYPWYLHALLEIGFQCAFRSVHIATLGHRGCVASLHSGTLRDEQKSKRSTTLTLLRSKNGKILWVTNWSKPVSISVLPLVLFRLMYTYIRWHIYGTLCCHSVVVYLVRRPSIL